MFGSEFTKTALGEFWTGTILGRFIIGPNLFCVVDRQWKKQRKIANPAFRRSMPLPLFGRLTQKLFKVIDSSTTGEDTPITINVHPLMKRWTLDTLGNASFEFDFGAIDDSNNEWVLRYETILHACEAPLFALFPFLERRFLNWFPERKRIHDELTLFLDKMQEIIDKKRNKLLEQQKQQQDELGQKKASPSSSDDSDYSNEDLLSLMIQNQLQETDVNNTLTDEELKSNLCVFFMAGNDTTTAALSFMIYHLAKHPEIQERARQEAFRVLGNEPTDIIPTIQQSQELVYITMVINETLRITGPADSLTPRTATKDTELGGVFIPKGTNVTVSLYELHHNPRFWDQPDVFDPERFASSDSQQNNGDDDDANNNSINATHCSNKEMFAPFSSGSRVCIGKNLSMAQQKLFLPMLLRKYRWDLPEDSIHREKVITETTMDVVHPVNLNINFKRIY
ncbi:cytochrome P450 [Phascolomyces articulosus]|uniref:Cytochrome P450 n=1 Tax=Phascolomyces articulosus TaxID=60185 RepID=A0AAD5K8Y0_9FUNG|nr:cytochrome P450 [Phascolomyces articulosus]